MEVRLFVIAVSVPMHLIQRDRTRTCNHFSPSEAFYHLKYSLLGWEGDSNPIICSTDRCPNHWTTLTVTFAESGIEPPTTALWELQTTIVYLCIRLQAMYTCLEVSWFFDRYQQTLNLKLLTILDIRITS